MVMLTYRTRETVDAEEFLRNENLPYGVKESTSGFVLLTSDAETSEVLTIEYGEVILYHSDGTRSKMERNEFRSKYEALDAVAARRIKAQEASKRARATTFGEKF
jgi:hypothetical protein